MVSFLSEYSPHREAPRYKYPGVRLFIRQDGRRKTSESILPFCKKEGNKQRSISHGLSYNISLSEIVRLREGISHTPLFPFKIQFMRPAVMEHKRFDFPFCVDGMYAFDGVSAAIHFDNFIDYEVIPCVSSLAFLQGGFPSSG